MSDKEFEEVVEECFDELSEALKKQMQNVAVTWEVRCPADFYTRKRLDPETSIISATYMGRPVGQNSFPAKITLYKRELVLQGGDGNRQGVKNYVKIALEHEIRHHFGQGEEQIRREMGR